MRRPTRAAMVKVHFKAEYALEFGETYELRLGERTTLRELLERLCQVFGKRFRLGVYDPEKGALMNVIIKIGLSSKKAVESLDVPVGDEDDVVIWPLDLGG